MIGTVAAVGPGEKKWKIGDRVGGPWHGGHDGTEEDVRRPRTWLTLVRYLQSMQPRLVSNVRQCHRQRRLPRRRMLVEQRSTRLSTIVFADTPADAEYCTLRSEATVSVPADVDPAAFCPLLCAGVTVFNSIRHQNTPPGETVAVQGLGGLGHLAIQYASKMGYRTVALSSGGSKEKFARDLGANEYIDGSKEDHSEALQKLGGASLIVATAPDPAILGKLVNGLGILGKLLILARMICPSLTSVIDADCSL